jgi:hypothetical protein
MPPSRRPGARQLREVPQPAVRYRVLLRVPRMGGRHDWMAASEAFAAALEEMRGASMPGAHIITAEVESERRRGRDQVTITVVVTVSAADAGTAFTAAWDTFGEAAAADPGGWDLAAASAEVAPVAALRGELIRARERGEAHAAPDRA